MPRAYNDHSNHDRRDERKLSDPPRRDIRTAYESTPACWSAIDANTYDGAPDGGGVIGYGKTEAEAVADLIEQLDEAEA